MKEITLDSPTVMSITVETHNDFKTVILRQQNDSVVADAEQMAKLATLFAEKGDSKMQYMVVSINSPSELEQKVDEYLSRGWKLVGGVSVVQYSDWKSQRQGLQCSSWQYSQALIKGDNAQTGNDGR